MLFATMGTPHCPICEEAIPVRSPYQMLEHLLSLPGGTEVEVRAPVYKIHGQTDHGSGVDEAGACRGGQRANESAGCAPIAIARCESTGKPSARNNGHNSMESLSCGRRYLRK